MMENEKIKISEADKADMSKCEKCCYVRKIDYENLKIYCNLPYCNKREAKRRES